MPTSRDATAVLLAAMRQLCAALTAPEATAADVAAVLAGEVHDDGAPLGLTVVPEQDCFQRLIVARQWNGGGVSSVELSLAIDADVPLAALTELAGSPQPLPRHHPDSPERVTFPRPPFPEAEGPSHTCTLTAVLSRRGSVGAVELVRDPRLG